MLSAQKPPVPARGPVPNADSAGKGASQAPLVRGACDLDHVRAGLRPGGGSSFIPTTWQPEPLRPSPGAALTHGMAVPLQGLGASQELRPSAMARVLGGGSLVAGVASALTADVPRSFVGVFLNRNQSWHQVPRAEGGSVAGAPGAVCPGSAPCWLRAGLQGVSISLCRWVWSFVTALFLCQSCWRFVNFADLFRERAFCLFSLSLCVS